MVRTSYTDAGEEQKALRHFFKGKVLVRSEGGASSDAAAGEMGKERDREKGGERERGKERDKRKERI